MNAIYLRRRCKVTVPSESGETSAAVIAALQKNIESLGFVLAPEVCERLRNLPLSSVDSFYKGLVTALRQMVGAHREFRPMYSNFPNEVMEMSAAQLYWNAIVHYCTNKLLPSKKQERTSLLDDTQPRVIGLGSREEFEGLFTLLASARTSLSEEDKSDLVWFIRQYRDDIERLLPDSFSHKENQAVIAAALLKYTSLGEGFISGHMKTATDILRVAAALSDGDVSLAEPTKFANLRRHHRVAFLSQLDRFPNREEDMRRWKNRWIRLGERLHPGDYARRFPNAFAGFDSLRNNKPSVSFNSELEGGLAEGRIDSAVTLLASRPGELARRLDHLVRKSKAPEAIVEVFQRKAGDVSTGVLLQVMAHFQARGLPQDLRTFFPKGQVASVYALPDQREPVLDEVSSAITAICEANLIKRFAKLPPLGRAYLDPELRNYLIPFSQRSAAKSLRTLVRGSRLPLPAGNALRFFIWWRNGSSRTDIDLSAALFDNSLKFVDDVAYYNLKNFSGCHSGDIVNAPQGAAEFIDLDIEKTKAHGVRYVVMSINSFTMQPYCDLPECFAGWMSRQHPNSGEIFEPRTVVDKVDVASNSKACLPAIFDLEARQVVWADIALRTRPRFNNVRNNLSGVSLMMRALLSLQKPTLHSLFGLHIKARGHLVANEAEADTIFSVREGITPFDLDRIAAEFI